MGDGPTRMYQMNLQSGNIEEIFKISNENNGVYTLFPLKNFLFAKQVNYDPQKEIYQQKETIYIADIDGNNIKKWKETDYNLLAADNQYIYEATYGYYIRDGWVTEPYIRVYNEQGEIMAECNPLEEGIDSYYSMYVMPGEHVFLYDNTRVYYFSKSEIETGEIHPKLLIDCSQYE